MLLIDIFLTDRTLFLTCVDKFFKFATGDVQNDTGRLLQVVNMFPKIINVYCDSELVFNSVTITSMLRNNYGIGIVSPLIGIQ